MSNQVYANNHNVIYPLRPRYFDDDNIVTTTSLTAVPLGTTFNFQLQPSVNYLLIVNQYATCTTGPNNIGFGVQTNIDGAGFNYVKPYILRASDANATQINTLVFRVQVPNDGAGVVQVRVLGNVLVAGTLQQSHWNVSIFPNAFVAD